MPVQNPTRRRRLLKGCILAFALLGNLPFLLGFVLLFGVVLPRHIIGPGSEHFEDIEKQMAEGALDNISTHYGTGLDYTGPPLTVDWRVKSVEKCPGMPSGTRFERLVEMGGGKRAEVEAYTLFGIPRGQVVIPCRDDLRWEPYF
jgi:hypothetical protein